MSRLMEMAREADTIAILGHTRPDGDCVGSCLAVCNYLLEQYPEKTVQVYLEKPADKFCYLKRFDTISQDAQAGQNYDLCICLDSGDKTRLGSFLGYLDGAKHSICLDHHVTNRGYAEENVVLADASSTCEVLYQSLEEEKISTSVAECLYTGIIHDTNVFKNSNTSAYTMEIAGKLMEKGIPFGKIIDDTFFKKSYVQNQILGRALLESISFMDGRCIFAAVRQKDLDFYGADHTDLEGIVDQLRVTDGVECAIFLHETENHVYKVSMRSNSLVDVSKVAAYFGGGGHIRAAGCTMNGSVHDVINNLSVHIAEQLPEEPAQEEETARK